MVSRLERGDGGADAVDHADALMAEDAARCRRRHIAFQDMQVGAADRGLRDPHDRIAGGLDDRLGAVLKLDCPGAA